MSAQSKRPLHDSDDDSEDDEDEFLVFGTALPALKEVDVDEDGQITGLRRKQSVWEQPVLDARGRALRFHGAFTGGFSAGYFNSVGSKEGWTPSTFVSQRGGAATDSSGTRPEDFMDAEDFSENGIAARRVHLTAQFDDSLARATLKRGLGTSLIPEDAVLRDLVVPQQQSVGERLMRHLGWKQGQGVGPVRGKKAAPPVKVYGCAAVPAPSEDDQDQEEDKAAVVDPVPLLMRAKVDTKGLGYCGLTEGSGALADRMAPAARDLLPDGRVRRVGIGGQAFGVGALETEDADIYAQEATSSYDWQLGGPDTSGERLHGWTAPSGSSHADAVAAAAAVCYQGRLLEGFVLGPSDAEQQRAAQPVYAPPVVPKGFTAIHRRTKLPTGAVTTGSASSSNTRPLDANARAEIMTPTPVPVVSSVFELMSAGDRDRLAAQRQRLGDSVLAAAVPEDKLGTILRQMRGVEPSSAPAPATVAPSRWDRKEKAVSAPEVVAPLHPVDRSQPLYGGALFKPFAADPEQQARFDAFQRAQRQSVSDPYGPVAPAAFTAWEREREREQFLRAAALFRPAAGLLGLRFTHGNERGLSSVVEGGLSTADAATDAAAETEREKAVRLKQFGQLTRDSLEWHPHNVLCRRFNVPNPFKDSEVVGVPQPAKHDRFSVFDMLSLPAPRSYLDEHVEQTVEEDAELDAPPVVTELVPAPDVLVKKKKSEAKALFASLFEEIANEESAQAAVDTMPAAAVQSRAPKKRDAANKNEAPGDDEDPDDDPLANRPSIDLFKAIFADDESDEESAASSDELEMAATSNEATTSSAAAAAASDAPQFESLASITSAELTEDVRPPSSPPPPPPPPPTNRRIIAASSLFAHLFEDTSASVLDRVHESALLSSTTEASSRPAISFPALSSSSDTYGPALPPNFTPGQQQQQTVSLSVASAATAFNRESVKKKEREEKMWKKKKKKEKKKKKKKQKKQKKLKEKKASKTCKLRHQLSSSDSDFSTDSADDVSDVDPLELHKKIASLRG